MSLCIAVVWVNVFLSRGVTGSAIVAGSLLPAGAGQFQIENHDFMLPEAGRLIQPGIPWGFGRQGQLQINRIPYKFSLHLGTGAAAGYDEAG